MDVERLLNMTTAEVIAKVKIAAGDAWDSYDESSKLAVASAATDLVRLGARRVAGEDVEREVRWVTSTLKDWAWDAQVGLFGPIASELLRVVGDAVTKMAVALAEGFARGLIKELN